MGWFERLSGSDKPEGARNASVAERIEFKRYRNHHPPLKDDEALRWDGCLFTGYHLHKTKKGALTEQEWIRTDEYGRSAKIKY